MCVSGKPHFFDGYKLGHGLRYPHGLLKRQLQRYYLPTISRVVRLPTLLTDGITSGTHRFQNVPF